jgi:DNA-binding NarL/FixJ family response regulator
VIRLLIADDHVFYREGVKSMLSSDAGDIVVVGEAATGDEAVTRAVELAPDVILMDLRMPGLTGIEATRRGVAHRPETAVLILTMFDDDSVFAAMRAGARGYLLKDATLGDLVRAVTAAHHGEAIFSPAIAQRLIRHFARNRPARDAGPFPELTDREREILLLIVRGRTNADIAVELRLTVKTVRNYVSNVLVKLQVHDRSQAVAKAREAGFPSGRDTG